MKEEIKLDSVQDLTEPKVAQETALSYDDVLLVPQKSEVYSRKDVDTSTFLTKKIKLNIPIISANMDTITEHQMAIALAREGGIGIIHRFLTIEQQVNEILKVKRSESIIIERPYTLNENQTLRDAKQLMKDKNVSGLLITDKYERLKGILTTRDIRFEDNDNVIVEELMTKDVVVAPVGTGIDGAKELIKKYKVEKIPIVDEEGNIFGLITSKDIQKRSMYPNAAKDKKGRLLVGAAIGVKGDYLQRAKELIDAKCDVLVIDIAHGHSQSVIDTIKILRKEFGDIQIIAGNVATATATEDLISAGADAIKVGVGPGAVCSTRIITGAGVPQFSAVLDCSRVGNQYDIPIIADGGIKVSGDLTKAIGAGASSLMLGNLLAGTEESPGRLIFKNGKRYKIYRGMAGYGAADGRKEKETGKESDLSEVVPEGVEGVKEYKGYVQEVLFQLVGGLRSGMSYCGATTIEELRKKAKFVKITSAGMRESKPHDLDVL